MQRTLKLALIGFTGFALAGSAALAQDAGSRATLNVAPAAGVTAPGSAVRGFDKPQPQLKLDLAPHELAGAPAQDADLAGSGQVPTNYRLPAADQDSYFNTRDYQDKNNVVQHRPGHNSPGRQLGGAAKGMALNAVIAGVGALINDD